MPQSYRIGELAQAAETPVETIRYYEHAGLMPAPRRTEGNYRLYEDTHRERLIFIRQCRALDMTLDEIHRLLAFKDRPTDNCDEVNALLEAHIGHVSERIVELNRLKKDLLTLRKQCQSAQQAAQCGILGGLSAGTATRHVRSDGPIARNRQRHQHTHEPPTASRKRR